ncbi:NUDIX hydrolase [Evansella cellulosilytica]|uniref:NUDIX hydrolase n=1 Tax=Evansella cellulosilytica (strain ATCC 21833 / DSM 2522 / FERM P-1141 / JCM 9156 / N-4) TaxID=649639 RepID=E6TXC5_EVAC2|nr:NUDIX hydrolase [Evansella cellulosilytica]ADU32320.1 NUDIX hydrolase [Evansella cellulosilytica DSM 2522]
MNKFIITSGAVVLNKHHKILLKKDPVRGWELPGGMVEENEPIKNAVVREVKEETGIDIDIVSFCGVSQELRKNICNMWWLGEPVSGELQTSVESVEVGFFSIEEALNMIVIKEFTEELLMCLDKKKHPFYIAF